jgi:hypothetical protein
MLSLVIMAVVIGYPLWSLIVMTDEFWVINKFWPNNKSHLLKFEWELRRVLLIFSPIFGMLVCASFFVGKTNEETFFWTSILLVVIEIIASCMGSLIKRKNL